MKKIVKVAVITIFILFSYNIYSQNVTVSIQGLNYTNNGQSTIGVLNCGNIDLASSTSTSINMAINLSKPYNLAVGDGNVIIYTKKSSTDIPIPKKTIPIPSVS